MSDVGGPYEGLEVSGPGPIRPPRRAEPGGVRILLRGMTKRCPRCGERDIFRRWLKIRDRCPRCRLRLEREEGGFLGAMTINYAVTTMLWIALLTGWLVVDLPDVRTVPLLVASLVLVGIFPLVFFPFSKTIWAALDFLIYRASPDYVAREAADLASGDGHRGRR